MFQGSVRSVLPLADGRMLDFVTIGQDARGTLVFHHGKPMAGDPPKVLIDAAMQARVRVVAYARPGYAGSSAVRGRDVAGAAADTAALLDHLGVARCMVMGWSAGGPHALACAAELGQRVTGVATVAGAAPREAGGLDWAAGMSERTIAEFRLAMEDADVLGAVLREASADFTNSDVGDMAETWGSGLPDIDKAAMESGLGEELMRSMKLAMTSGIEGLRDDDVALVSPWGFDVADIGTPLAIWQGGADLIVPADHGRWLAEHVPGAQLRLLVDEGHLSLLSHAGEMIGGLLGTTG